MSFQRVDPRTHVARLSLEDLRRALRDAEPLGLERSTAEQLEKIALDVVLDSGELTVAGVREEARRSERTGQLAGLLASLLTQWIELGKVELEPELDGAPIESEKLRAGIAATSPERLPQVERVLEILDPEGTGQVRFIDIKALRADLEAVQRDLEDPLAAGARTLQSFLMSASAGELAKLLPDIQPGAERFSQPFDPLTRETP